MGAVARGQSDDVADIDVQWLQNHCTYLKDAKTTP
jgi:hypothetical protein